MVSAIDTNAYGGQLSTPRRIPSDAEGSSVRFFSGDDLSEGQRGSCSATRPEPALETSIVCGAR